MQSGFDNKRAMHALLTTHSQCWRNEGDSFPDRVLTIDESWIHSFDHQLKRQNVEWRFQVSPRKKIAQ